MSSCPLTGTQSQPHGVWDPAIKATLVHHWIWISESGRGLRRVVLAAGCQGLPCVSVVSNHPVDGESIIPSRAAKPFHVGQLMWMHLGPQSCYTQDT